MSEDLSDAMREVIRSGARKLTGFRRRQFQAEVALRYCQGSARRAERRFGWGRDAVDLGLNELRTGVRCVDNFSGGRPKTEERDPTLVERIQAIVDPSSQADPKFQTSFAFTRIAAKAVRAQLAAAPTAEGHLPAERTIHDILNRLGYRLRRVRKTKPQKKFPRPTPSLRT